VSVWVFMCADPPELLGVFKRRRNMLADESDREVIAFDGQVMILRWVDAEVTSRYGIMVFARCGG